MIFVDRNNVVAPSSLIDKGGAGRNESAKVLRFYRIAANYAAGTDYKKYKAYKGKDVKKQLTTLFNGKCAYCESKIIVVTSPDIEHFRPKAGTGKDERNLLQPGYYWLASSWENLLLSCASCNRKNTFEIVNVGSRTVGKLNQFPLARNTFRLRLPSDDFDREESVRLLINPCLEDPEEHIYFDDDGIIFPKSKNRGVSRKGTNSIEVYVLQRKALVDDRKVLIKKIKAQIVTVDRCLKRQNDVGKGVDPEVDNWLNDEITKLRGFLDPYEPYQAVARQYIRPYMLATFGIAV